ncbi:hypothetical protein TWF506_005827 [Arthrobotrys conoides]|uniref:Uncharacterized protein n=1 Tax=Arthrobotrys conoides TaxID=74498 RepID=A0AAN8NEU6_9PEZI
MFLLFYPSQLVRSRPEAATRSSRLELAKFILEALKETPLQDLLKSGRKDFTASRLERSRGNTCTFSINTVKKSFRKMKSQSSNRLAQRLAIFHPIIMIATLDVYV